MTDPAFFDAHVALGPRRVAFRGQDWSTADVARRLAECGIREALAYHTLSVEDHPAIGNARILEELRGIEGIHPVWALLPFGTRELGTPEQLRGSLREHGIRGVLFYPAEQTFSPEPWCCGSLYDLLEGMRMPVFVRSSPPDLSWSELHDLLAAHPKLPVVLRNLGYSLDRNLYPLLERCPNLFLETTKYFPFRGIEEVARLFGAERLVFGSETPFLSPGAAVTPVLLADLSEADRRLIAGGNLRRLVAGIDYEG